MKEIVDAYRKMQTAAKVVPIQESTLSPSHKDRVDFMADHANDYMDSNVSDKIHAVLGDHKFKTFPLAHSTQDADPDVVEHLYNHGYDIDDYQKGIAAKKVTVGNPEMGIPNREKIVKHSIGAVLQKTNAEPHVVKAFTHDPARTSTTKATGHHVVISQTPYAVAGMSTGTSWNSCMNLNGGANSHYIPADLRHGTHVAYMVHHDDETAFKHGEPSKPIARIALKPFHNEDDHDDVIFRPEESHYGNPTPAFTNAVSQWAIHNYPAKSGVTYHKHDDVYDDSGNSEYVAHDINEVKKSLNGGYPIVDRTGQMVDHHVIDSAIDHIKTNLPSKMAAAGQYGKGLNVSKAIQHMSQIGNLSPKHVLELSRLSKNETSDHKSNMWNLAVTHGSKFSTAMHHEFVAGGSKPTNSMITSTKFPDEMVDTLPNNQLSLVRRSKIKDHHVDKVVDALTKSESGSFYDAREMKWAMKPHHIDKLVNAGKGDLAVDHEHFTEEHHDKMLRSPTIKSSELSSILGKSKHATFADYMRFSDRGHNRNILTNFMSNKNIAEPEMKKLADHVSETPHRNLHIGSELGKHIDYTKMAQSANPESHSFTSPEHSWKMVDALHDEAQKTDEALFAHNHGKNDDFDQDDHWNALEKYKDSLEKHFDDHAHDGDTVINQSEIVKVHDRLHTHSFGNEEGMFDDLKHKVASHYD